MGKRAMELALVTAQRHGDDAGLYVIEKCHTLGVPSDVPVHHRTGGASYLAGPSIDAHSHRGIRCCAQQGRNESRGRQDPANTPRDSDSGNSALQETI